MLDELRDLWLTSSAEVAADVVEGDGDEEVVDVVAAEVGVAAGGDDFEDAVVELEDGDVEGAAAEVVDGDDAVLLLVEAVGEGGGGGLVDQAQDVEAGDAAGVLGGLALRVVEVGGDGDDGLGDGRAEEALGVLLELQQDVGGDFGRREGEAADVELEDFAGLEAGGEAEGEELELVLHVGDAAAHEALDGVDGVGGVGEQTLRGGVADGEACAVSWSKATTEGTMAVPSSPGMTAGVSPCMKAMRELVVPRSMPTTGAVVRWG